MTLFWDYNLDTPLATNKPSVDQPKMKLNTNNIDNFLSVDHFGFNINNGGTHQQCQLFEVPGGNGTIPSGLQGLNFETLYSSLTSGVGDLWFVRGASGTGIRLTGPGTPSANFNGYTTLPGGILMQWGRSAGNSLSSTGLITFPTPFINNVFVICPTLISKSAGTSETNTVSYITGSQTLTNWRWNYTGTTSYVGFYWVAIGN